MTVQLKKPAAVETELLFETFDPTDRRRNYMAYFKVNDELLRVSVFQYKPKDSHRAAAWLAAVSRLYNGYSTEWKIIFSYDGELAVESCDLGNDDAIVEAARTDAANVIPYGAAIIAEAPAKTVIA